MALVQVDASPQASEGGGFLRFPTTSGPPISRQNSEAVVSWSHSTRYDEDNPGGWLLFHIGNVMVRESDGQGDNLDVRISFGGENPYWCGNIVVDFSALAPVYLAWDIVRVVLIGNRKGRASTGVAPPCGETIYGAQGESSGGSPLSALPPVVIDLILGFSQPTLVRPRLDGEALQQGGEGGVGGNGHTAPWTVF